MTGRQGGSWTCENGANVILAEEHYTRGDPFGLASGRLPFVMPKGAQLTMQDVARRAGLTIQEYL